MFRRTTPIGGALAVLVAVLAVACSRNAHALEFDVVQLKSGDTLEGKIIAENDERIQLEVNRGTLWIPLTDIARIRRGQRATPLTLERLKRLAEEIKRATESNAGVAGGEGEVAEPKMDPRIPGLVAALGSADEGERKRARSDLEDIGAPAIPELTAALKNRSVHARTAAAEMLGRMSARQSVRDLIVALRSAIPDKRKVRPWQRRFVRALNGTLRRLTGQNIDIRERGFSQDKIVQKYVDWWDGAVNEKGEIGSSACVEWDTPQLGEPEIAEDDEERVAKLWEARKVGTRRHSYQPPKGFLDGVSGDVPR